MGERRDAGTPAACARLEERARELLLEQPDPGTALTREVGRWLFAARSHLHRVGAVPPDKRPRWLVDAAADLHAAFRRVRDNLRSTGALDGLVPVSKDRQQ